MKNKECQKIYSFKNAFNEAKKICLNKECNSKIRILLGKMVLVSLIMVSLAI